MSGTGLDRVTVRACVIAAVFAGTFALTQVVTPAAPAAPPALEAIPIALGPWVGAQAPALAPDVAEILAADQYLHRYYTAGGGTIEMDVAYYSRPRVGANMHSPLNCLPGNGWEVTATRSIAVTAGGTTWPIRELAVERRGHKYLLVYWFQSRNRIVSDEVSSRFYLLADALRGRATDAGLVRLVVPVSATTPMPDLEAFASRLIPEIGNRLN